MNIIVCVKQVPDTEAQIIIKGKTIDKDDIKFVLNPLDEYALEEAIKIKEDLDGEVTAVTMAPERAKEALLTCLAMGADNVIHLCDERLDKSDVYGTALALSKVIKGLAYNLVLCGQQAIDSDTAQVGASLAEFLGLPFISGIVKLDLADGKAVVTREIEGGSKEVLEVSLPVVLSAKKGLNDPRYPSLIAIKKAKKKPIDELNLEKAGISPEEVGENSSFVAVERYFYPPKRGKVKLIEGETPKEKACSLVKSLRDQA